MLKTIIIQIAISKLKEEKRDDIISELDQMFHVIEKNNAKVVVLDPNHYDRTKNQSHSHSAEDNVQKQINNLIMICYHKEECLIISDQASTILTAYNQQIPCMGYDNPVLEKQDLFKANMLVEGFGEVDYKFLTDVYNRFYNLPITIATTNRIVIREMVVEDLDELYRLYANPEITRFLETLYENREEEIEFTKAYIKHMYGFYGYGMWSLLDKKTGKLIGRAGLNNRDLDGEIQIELGYMIGVPYQRQGYAYESCHEILKFAVDKLECFKINCFINHDNEASVSLVKKLGFQYIQEVEIGVEKLSLYRWTYN